MEKTLLHKRWNTLSKDFQSKNLYEDDMIIQEKIRKRRSIILGLVSMYVVLLIISLMLL